MRTLGARLTWGYAVVVLMTVIATLGGGYFLLRAELTRGIDLLNFAEFREIRARLERDRRPVAEGEFIRRVAEHAEIDAPLYFFQVSRSDGAVIFRSPNMGAVVFDVGRPRSSNWTSTVASLGMIRIGQYEEGNYVVQIASSLGNIRQFSSYYLQVSVVVSGVALVLSIFFGHRLSRLALDPIRRIQEIAERISADNLSMRLPSVRGNDEIARLVRLLNQMFDRLETSFDRLGRFVGEASHELKTPLSLIRLQSEKLLLHDDLAAGQQEVIQQQLGGIDRLTSVIDRLLFLAKSKVGGIRPNARLHDTASFIRGFEEDARVLCEDQHASFQVAGNEPLTAIFDPTLLRHVLLNLLTNALRVTPTGSGISLSSRAVDANWEVCVEDAGPGVPADQLERIFEPFARIHSSDCSTTGEDTGTGLGLAICRGILEVHEGFIRAENLSPGPGLRVAFTLPLLGRTAMEPKPTLALPRVVPRTDLEGVGAPPSGAESEVTA